MQPVITRLQRAARWAAAGATAVAWDFWALRRGHVTLSSAYAAASHHLVGKVVLLAGNVVLLAHLWKFPRAAASCDPLGMAVRRLSGGSTR